MPNITGLISNISDAVVAALSAANYPPLTDGKILLSWASENLETAPPRIVFIPLSARWAPPSPGTNSSPTSSQNPNAPGAGVRLYTMTAYGMDYVDGSTTVTVSAPDIAGGVQATATPTVTSNGAVSRIVPAVIGSGYLSPPTVTVSGVGTGATATASLQPTPQALAVIRQRAIQTEWHKFEVHCWGQYSASSPDPNQDYDFTQALYQQVVASTHALCAGVYELGDGTWVDASRDATQVVLAGREYVFQLTIAAPVLAEPLTPASGAAVQFAPPQTQSNPTTDFAVIP